MAKLTTQETELLRLIARSPDAGDGWRQASPAIYTLWLRSFGRPELVELDDENLRIRLSERGSIILEYV